MGRWEDIEDATQDAIARASGFPSTQVCWSYEDVDEPTLPHITINFGGEIRIGQEWIKNTQDLSKPVGFEIKQEVKGVREVPLEVSVFTPNVTGSRAARRTAELIRSKLRLSSIRYGLTKVGLSPFDPGPVAWVPDIPSTNFRGRAQMTIRCYVPVLEAFETTTYIAGVKGMVFPTGFIATGFIPSHYSGASGIPFDTANRW